jgi:GcrA cell cycle regulator
MSWTDERVEQLKKLWQDGLSASQIAGRIGGVTRNAVIGKVHRLGLAGRATTSRMKSHRPRRLPPPTRTRVPQKPSRFNPAPISPLRDLYRAEAEVWTPPVEDVVIPLHERKTLNQLTDTCCRWPIGDPQLADFHFCARKKVPGLPYCETHARRAFQPPQARRRDAGAPSYRTAIEAPRIEAMATTGAKPETE